MNGSEIQKFNFGILTHANFSERQEELLADLFQDKWKLLDSTLEALEVNGNQLKEFSSIKTS